MPALHQDRSPAASDSRDIVKLKHHPGVPGLNSMRHLTSLRLFQKRKRDIPLNRGGHTGSAAGNASLNRAPWLHVQVMRMFAIVSLPEATVAPSSHLRQRLLQRPPGVVSAYSTEVPTEF